MGLLKARRPVRVHVRGFTYTPVVAGLSLVQQIIAARLEAPVLEYRFCQERRFRFDLCWPARKLALEVDGGVWRNGRHSRGSGVTKDCEKYSLAAIHGWSVMRVTTDMVRDGQALQFIERALKDRT